MTIDPKETNRSQKSVFYSRSNEEREAILTEIDEDRRSDRLEELADRRDWAQKMRATAPPNLAILRQHIPSPQIREVEEFMSDYYVVRNPADGEEFPF